MKGQAKNYRDLSLPARLPARLLLAIFCTSLQKPWQYSSWRQRHHYRDTMGKKKTLSNTQTSKAAAKAAKKAKAAQKTERKEKRKSGKGKDEFDDDQDLEAILENVSDYSPLLRHLV